MNIRAYLKPEVTEHKDVKSAGGAISFGNIRIQRTPGDRLYLDFDHHEGRVPIVLMENDLVEEFSLFHDFERIIYRERGLYKHQSAEAELEVVSYGEKRKEYRAHIKAKNVDDLLDLLRMIKTGSLPPSQSYDGTQVKKSDETINLVSELQEFSKSLKEARGTTFSSKKSVAGRIDQLISRLS